MDLTRRKTLYGSSLVALTALAGCLEDTPASSETASQGGNGDENDGGDDNGDDDGNDDESLEAQSDGEDTDPDDSGGDDGADEYALADYETLTYSVGQGETDAEALYSKADAEDAIDDSQVSEETRDDIEGFLEETDFSTSKIVSLQVRAHNLCYGLEIEAVDADEDGAVVRASAIDESGSDELCAPAKQTLCGLVRMEFEGDVPKSGTVTLTDSRGESHRIGYAVDVDETDDGE